MVTTISNGTKLVAVFTQCGHIQVGWYMHTAPLQLSCWEKVLGSSQMGNTLTFIKF